jgi:hypothetical protein
MQRKEIGGVEDIGRFRRVPRIGAGGSDRYSAKAGRDFRIYAAPTPTNEADDGGGRAGSRRIMALQTHAQIWVDTHMPFRCTAQCGFKIKYQFKNCRLKVYTSGEHSHENEIRKRGLKLEKASKLLEVVPTSK